MLDSMVSHTPSTALNMTFSRIRQMNTAHKRSERMAMHRRKRKGRRDRNNSVGKRESIRWARPPYLAWHSSIFDE